MVTASRRIIYQELTERNRELEHATLEMSEMAEPSPPAAFPSELPVLPLRRTVAFPLTLQPLAVNRFISVEAVNAALAGDRLILLLLQKGDDDEPSPDAMYEVGTIGIVRQMARGPQGLNIIVEGMARARAEKVFIDSGMIRAK